ncbi:hypothetical protein T02_9480, partial [Trichinella nativa]
LNMHAFLLQVAFLGLILSFVSTYNTCDNKFAGFFDCIKQKTNQQQTYSSLEREFDDDHQKLIDKCFASSSSEAQSKNMCVLDKSTLEVDVLGPNGPLRSCNFCQKIAKVVHDKYFKSTPAERQCLRRHMIDAAVAEIQPCMQSKLHDFSYKVPTIPDFDSAADNLMQLVEDSLRHRIWVQSRLDVCSQVNPGRATNTRSCLDRGFPGMYEQTCRMINECRQSTTQANCMSRFDELHRAACSCLKEKREELGNKVEKLKDALMSSTSSSDCTSKVEAAAGAWKTKLIQALKDCYSDGGSQGISQIPATKLVEIGCLRATQMNTNAKKEFAIGFRFLRTFLDVMQDRGTRFCSCQN